MAKIPIPEGVFINWNISRKKYKPTYSEIEEILTKHQAWINGEPNGNKADLSNADLTLALLSNADLTSADLRGADLSNADLYRANLKIK